MEESKVRMELVSKQKHKLNPDCVLSFPDRKLTLTSFYTLNRDTNTHIGEIQVNIPDENQKKLFSVLTPGIFDMQKLEQSNTFVVGDVDKGLGYWKLGKENDEIQQIFRTELNEKIIYVDLHKINQSVKVAATMEQGYTSYLQLDEGNLEFKELHQWKDATNTIWACKLLQDRSSLASGGDFGKYFFYDLRTNVKTFTNTQ